MEYEPAEPRLYVRRDGQVEGPFPPDAVRIMVRRKELSKFTQVQREGSDSWITFAELPQPNLPQPTAGMWPLVAVILIVAILVGAAIFFLLAKR